MKQGANAHLTNKNRQVLIFILTRNDNQLKTNRHFVVIDRAILPVASLAAICITITNFANTITLVVGLSITVVRSDLRLTNDFRRCRCRGRTQGRCAAWSRELQPRITGWTWGRRSRVPRESSTLLRPPSE